MDAAGCHAAERFFASRGEATLIRTPARADAGAAGFLCASATCIAFFPVHGTGAASSTGMGSEAPAILLSAPELLAHALNAKGTGPVPLLKISVKGQDITQSGPQSGVKFAFLPAGEAADKWALRDAVAGHVAAMLRRERDSMMNSTGSMSSASLNAENASAAAAQVRQEQKQMQQAKQIMGQKGPVGPPREPKPEPVQHKKQKQDNHIHMHAKNEPTTESKMTTAQLKPKTGVDGLRDDVLKKSGELAFLYDELVTRTGVLTEDEFWQLRRQSLVAEASGRQHQNKGLPSEMQSSLAATASESNQDKVLVLSSRTVAQILQTDNRVRRAHADMVPLKCTEKEFWERYFRAQAFWKDQVLYADTDTISSSSGADKAFVGLHESADRHYTQKGSIVRRKISQMVDPDVDITADDDVFGFGSLGPDSGYGAGFSGALAVGEHDHHVDDAGTADKIHRQAVGVLRRYNRHAEVTVREAAGAGARLAVDLAADEEGEFDFPDRGQLESAQRASSQLRQALLGDVRAIADLSADKNIENVPLAIEDPRLYFAGAAHSAPKTEAVFAVADTAEFDADVGTGLAALAQRFARPEPPEARLQRIVGGGSPGLSLWLDSKCAQMQSGGDVGGAASSSQSRGIREPSSLLVNAQAVSAELLQHFWNCIDVPSSAERASKLIAAIRSQRDTVLSRLKERVSSDEKYACDALADVLNRAVEKHDRVTKRRARPPPPMRGHGRGMRPAAPVRGRI